MTQRFPVGGSRQAAFDFIRSHGYIIENPSNDKHWKRHDGRELHLYGAGSMARIYDKDRNLIADDELDIAIKVQTPATIRS